MKPAIPTSISSRLASMEKAIREMHQQGDSYDELGHELIRHAKRTHSIASAITADVWALRDALKLMPAGAEPDWCNFRVSGISYDADPGVVHQRIADRPQVVRDVPTPDGKPAVDPRIVPRATVRILDASDGARIYRGPNSPDCRKLEVGDEVTVERTDARWAIVDEPAILFVNGFGQKLTPSHLEFVSPPPTFAPATPDRVHGSPFAAADSTPAVDVDVTGCMDVFGDDTGTISFADQVAAAMQAERLMGEDTPTVERMIARHGDPKDVDDSDLGDDYESRTAFGYPRMASRGGKR